MYVAVSQSVRQSASPSVPSHTSYVSEFCFCLSDLLELVADGRKVKGQGQGKAVLLGVPLDCLWGSFFFGFLSSIIECA